MVLIRVIYNASVMAIGLIAEHKEILFDYDVVFTALKEIIKEEFENLQADLKQALEANMGDEIYKEILNVACNGFAIKALKKSGYWKE